MLEGDHFMWYEDIDHYKQQESIMFGTLHYSTAA